MTNKWRPTLLLPAEVEQPLRELAARRGVDRQELMRDAVLSLLDSPAKPPPPAAHKLREAAATARALADQLAALAGGLPAELEPDTITISTESLIQMLTEAVQNGPDTPVEARIERVQRIVAEIGEAVAPPAAPDRSATPTDRRKRGSNR